MALVPQLQAQRAMQTEDAWAEGDAGLRRTGRKRKAVERLDPVHVASGRAATRGKRDGSIDVDIISRGAVADCDEQSDSDEEDNEQAALCAPHHILYSGPWLVFSMQQRAESLSETHDLKLRGPLVSGPSADADLKSWTSGG